MATVTGMLSSIVAQTLQPTIDVLTLDASTFCAEMYKSSAGVWKNPNIGRDWKVTRNFSLGLGGAVEMASKAGPDIADMGSATGFNVYEKVETWPGLGEATAPAYVTRELTLKRMLVNMYIPVKVIELAQLRASIGNHMERTIRATAKNVVYTQCNLFLAGSRNQMGSFTLSGGPTTLSSSGTEITLDAGSSIRRFASGQRVDIFVHDSNVRKNTDPVFVDNVDPFGTSASPIESGGGKLKLFHVGSASTVLADDTYDIVPRNCGRELGTWPAVSARMPTNLDSVIVDSGSVFGMSVSTYTDLKSMVRTLGGSVPTGGLLMKYVAHYINARGGLNSIDSLWAQIGVWAAYFNSLNTEFMIERNGSVVTVKDGFAKNAGFSFGGYSLPFMSDPWLAEKTIYGLKWRNNWTIITPPRYPGSKSHPAFDAGIQFMWPLLNGGSSIFGGYRKVGGADAGAFSDFLEAPGERSFEIAPEIIPGLKLTNAADYYG